MSQYNTEYLMRKEVEAWWHMLKCVFNFVIDSLYEAVENPSQYKLVLSDISNEFNLEDFPFAIKLFYEESFRDEQSKSNTEKSQHSWEADKYLKVFERCCQSMHKLEDKCMQDYEDTKERILESLIANVKNVVTNPQGIK